MNSARYSGLRFMFCLIVIIAAVVPSAGAQNQIYKVAGKLPYFKQMYGAAVLGDHLYMIGGNDQSGFTSEILMAPINPDGTIGGWVKTTPLPDIRAYINNLTVTLNDVLYVISGYSSKPDASNSKKPNLALWTRPGADGHLEPWRTSPPYPGKGVSCSVSVATPGYLNLLGGYDESENPIRDVWAAKVAPDGSIASREPGPPLPVPLWFHCAGVSGGRVWVWGGLTANDKKATNKTIFVAPILSSGKIGSWAPLTNMELNPPYSQAVCSVSGNYLLSFCPRYTGGVESNDIYFSAVTMESGLSPWQKITTDFPIKLYFGIATDYRRNIIFIPGGRKAAADKTMDLNVYSFRVYTAEPADQQIAATSVPAGVPAGGENLSYLSQEQQARSVTARFPGIIPYEQARQQSLANKLPMVIYCHTDKAARCVEQAGILQTFDPAPYAQKVVFSEIHIGQFPQFSQQHGVFRVPCWVFFDSQGGEIFRSFDILKLPDLEANCKKIM
ncbi:MAG TPA: hypothetical protein PLB62_09470 [Candidatus Sumerlaeota bacterium]|nr:hypothetical protein [Candidatus Sumerlaeota bacterium]